MMTMTERLAIHKEIEQQNRIHLIDFLHGPVVDFRSTATADIWMHADGYKEIAWHEDQEVQAL